MPDGNSSSNIPPDSKVQDTQEDFENDSQINASGLSDATNSWSVNRKRTYDVYQDFDVQAVRSYHRHIERIDSLLFQSAQNAIETANLAGKQALRHADVATDALWTDELNPTMHGAESVMAGQAPVNSQLASTSSLDTAFTNLTAQNGQLVAAFISAMNNLTNSNAAQAALIAQLIQNAKQSNGTTAPAAAKP